MPSSRDATSATSTSTSPSATGNWRASSKASTPATRAAPTGRRTTTGSRSPIRSCGWPRRPTRPRRARVDPPYPPPQRAVSLYELRDAPRLVEPVLVVAMEGWVDAGLGAAAAVAAILASATTDVVATFDADTVLDH